MKKNCGKIGFTLPEALLVLIILGIIGAICIQSLKTYNPHQKGYDTKAEKAVSIVGQAVTMVILEESSSDDMMGLYDENGKFNITQSANAARIVKKFKKHLNINELPLNTSDEYFSGDFLTYKRQKIAKLNSVYSNFLYLNDGMLLGFRFYGNCTATEANANPPGYRDRLPVNNICASVFVDVNGEKKPNKLGSDQIVIPLDEKGIKFNND